MDEESLNRMKEIIDELSEEEKNQIFSYLREYINIHPIERLWNASAENILEAIYNAGPLNQRAVKGMLSEAYFKNTVLKPLANWEDVTPLGDLPFDFMISDSIGNIRIQVKNQRSRKGEPMIITGKYGESVYIAETQKTRNGEDAKGDSTRAYRFGDFDILAVCMYASSGRWDSFLFTLERWLLPNARDNSLINTFQPIPIDLNEASKKVWTKSLDECIAWLRSGRTGNILPNAEFFNKSINI
jgi:hypothetical protein